MDQTTETVALVGWRKQEGDSVVEGEVVCDIETDKATVEIPSPASGRLRKILVPAGSQVPPRTVVAWIGNGDDPLPALDTLHAAGQSLASAPAQAPATVPPKPAAPVPAGQKSAASPRAKRLAEQHGLDLATVRGSGPAGRILEEDIQKIIDRAPTAESAADSAARRAAQAKAERVSRSWHTIPHFYTSLTIDLSTIVAAKPPAGITLTDYFLLAAARALELHPALNGHWVDDRPVSVPEIRLGLVVETDQGLIIPALPDLRGLSLQQIAAERSRLVEQARGARLGMDAATTPTFTLSNLGPGHVDQFTAIISPPQVAILSVGSVQARALVIGADIVARPSAVFTLGADHRAIDGRQAARFLDQLKTELETVA